MRETNETLSRLGADQFVPGFPNMGRWFADMMNAPFQLFSAARELGARATDVNSGLELAVDVFEDEGQVIVRAEIPGVSKKDIEVELEGNSLTIMGEKRHQTRVKREDYYRAETSSGYFRRSIDLPEVKQEEIKATFANGVLEIRVPRAEESHDDRIRIEVS